MFGMDENDFHGGYNNFGDMLPLSQGQDKKIGSKLVQVIIPCTINMIMNAEYFPSDDTFKFEGYRMQQLMVVGIIREVIDATTNIVFKIDDGTHGNFLVARYWLADKNILQKDKPSLCREDMFVRVSGLLKSAPDNDRNLMIFDIQPITDYNEITFHILNTIHSFSYQMTVVSKNPKNSRNSILSMGNTSMNALPSFGMNVTNSSGLQGASEAVLNVIKNFNGDGGICVTEIKSKLPNLSETDIRKVINFLSGEGHIYSTIDDEHYSAIM